ncbi:hypothetical protein TWF730_010476 [Orbilia blumenaviensis]|uniref:Uncharacterized protein n=1 Tax=Orbilia blumenaviensis TaxID=1796055 RepID=A0AAV9UP66_9PEZI
MVCEYTLFTFPECGCPALVPIQFCPQHLDPSHKDYYVDPSQNIHLTNPARITMLFASATDPIPLGVYRVMCQLYDRPLLAIDPNLTDPITQREFYELAKAMISMEARTAKWHDGGKVKAGFHTKLCRYHVIYPDCVDIRIHRPANDAFWPFAEEECLVHRGGRSGEVRTGEGVFELSKIQFFEKSFIAKIKQVSTKTYEYKGTYVPLDVSDVEESEEEEEREEGDDNNDKDEDEDEVEEDEEAVTGVGRHEEDNDDEDNEEEEQDEDEDEEEEEEDDGEGSGSEYSYSEAEDEDEDSSEEVITKADKTGKEDAAKTETKSTTKPLPDKPRVPEHKVATTVPINKRVAPKKKIKKRSEEAWKGSEEEDDDEESEEEKKKGAGKKKPAAKKSNPATEPNTKDEKEGKKDKTGPKTTETAKKDSSKSSEKTTKEVRSEGSGKPEVRVTITTKKNKKPAGEGAKDKKSSESKTSKESDEGRPERKGGATSEAGSFVSEEVHNTSKESKGSESGPKDKKKKGKGSKDSSGSKSSKDSATGKGPGGLDTKGETKDATTKGRKKETATKEEKKKTDTGEAKKETATEIGGKETTKGSKKRLPTTQGGKPVIIKENAPKNNAKTTAGPGKPATKARKRGNGNKKARGGDSEDELSSVFEDMSPKGPVTKPKRPRRGEEEPEFTGLRGLQGKLDEVGSGLRLYRAPARASESLFTEEEMEEFNFPSANQSLDEIFDGWAETQLKKA